MRYETLLIQETIKNTINTHTRAALRGTTSFGSMGTAFSRARDVSSNSLNPSFATKVYGWTVSRNP